MYKKTKLFTMLMVLLSILSTSFITAYAQDQNTIKTNVTIHKLQADAFNETIPSNENGLPIGTEELGKLGTNVRGLAGVTFEAYEITAEQYENNKNGVTIDKPADGAIVIGTTREDGTVVWEHELQAKEGAITPKYYVVYETAKPDNVSKSIAVPFVIAFPMTHSTDGTYLTDVHIYPKNITGTFPEVGKDVKQLGTNSSDYNIGDTVPFILKGTIPTNIEVYTTYTFKDTLSNGFTYDSDSANISVKVGTEPLDPSEYSVSYSGKELSISITPEAIAGKVLLANRNKVETEEIKNLSENSTLKPFVEVQFNVILNGDAVIDGEGNKNIAALEFNNGQFTENKRVESDEVVVKTSGKKFIKIDHEKAPLDGAQFEIQKNGATLKWNASLLAANKDAIDSGKFIDAKGTNPIIAVSSTDGTFEIKGLEWSKEGVKYTAKEIKAPEGKALLNAPVEFNVVDLGYTNSEPQEIINHPRPIIPETGGIGSVIFVLIGLMLMVLAIFGYKKATQE